MSKNYFTEEQIKKMLRELGFINLDEVSSKSQLKALMNLGVESVIGAPVARVSPHCDFKNYSCIRTDRLDITSTKHGESILKDGDNLYAIKECLVMREEDSTAVLERA